MDIPFVALKLFGFDSDADFSLICELNGVVNQVEDNLTNTVGITEEFTSRIVVYIEIEADAFFPRFDENEFESLDNGILEIKGRHLDFDAAGFYFGIIENVVDKFEQRIAAAFDDFDVFALGALHFGLIEQIGKADNSVHGSTNFMAHHSQELSLGGVGLIRRFLCRLERALSVPAVGDVISHPNNHRLFACVEFEWGQPAFKPLFAAIQ